MRGVNFTRGHFHAHRSPRGKTGGFFFCSLAFLFKGLASLQLIQMLQPRQDNLFARLFDLTGEENLVQDGVDLVEVEDQIQLAYVAKESV